MVEGPENPFSFLQQFLASRADTLLMRVGYTPVLYENGQDRELGPTELGPADVLSIIKSITPDAQQQLLKDVGFAEFDSRTQRFGLRVEATWNESIKEIRFRRQH